MQIHGILFDIGDTLIGATHLQRKTLGETVRHFETQGLIRNPRSFIRAYQEADHHQNFDELTNLNHLYSDKRIITRALRLLSKRFDSNWTTQFLRTYRRILRKNIIPNAATIAVLMELRIRGIKLGIVSNGTTKEQFDQLRRLQIKDFFDPILVSQRERIRKPDPRIFLQAAEQWDLPPAEILVVGDRVDWEVLGARRAGMQSTLTTQFVKRRRDITSALAPDWTIANLCDLLAIVEGGNNGNGA